MSDDKYEITPGKFVNLSPVVKKIGKHSFVGVVDSFFNAEVEIGDYTSVGSVLYVHGATEHPCVFDRNLVSTFPFGDKWDVDYPKADTKGKIKIGNDVWIGSYVTILSGVTIGDGAIIGSNSVIARDVPPYAVVIGNPAWIIRWRFTPAVVRLLQEIKWWRWSEKKIKENIELMKDVRRFVEKWG